MERPIARREMLGACAAVTGAALSANSPHLLALGAAARAAASARAPAEDTSRSPSAALATKPVPTSGAPRSLEAAASPDGDWRDIRQGRTIPTAGYCDQPYVVVLDDGSWLCVVTTGAGREGERGQSVLAMRSDDQGRTWSDQAYIEPLGGPEASWAVPLLVPRGRIFAFYVYNAANLRQVIADRGPSYPDGICTRVDSLGNFVLRFSDDGGRSWSPRRYTVPVREMAIDRANPYGGAVRFFWNVGKPFVLEGAVYVPLHKVGGFGEGFFTSSEGVLLRSADLAHMDDPARARWETLPLGEAGLRAPDGGGPIAEEQSCVSLRDGSLYVVYRTIDGYPAESYSRDGGRTWEAPRHKRYADGRLMKHPRAANFVWRCTNGRYLYWFHNHGGHFLADHPARSTIGYRDRNPGFLCTGSEVEGPHGRVIAWSEPEVVLFDDDPTVRISYPDLIEDASGFYLTETQKTIARVHRLDDAWLQTLWRQTELREPIVHGLLLALPAAGATMPETVALPPLPDFSRRSGVGITIELWLRPDVLAPGQVLLDNRDSAGRGFCLAYARGGAVEVSLCDGRSDSHWRSDSGGLTAGWHHVVAIVDAGPRLVLFVVDGRLQDGGEQRQFGWGRINPDLRTLDGERLRLAPGEPTCLGLVRIYERALMVSEAISSWRSSSGGF